MNLLSIKMNELTDTDNTKERNKLWYESIIQNNTDAFHQLLTGTTDKETLLNSDIEDNEGQTTTSAFPIKKPLCLAIGSGAVDVFDLMIQEGADVLIKDIHGSNILHVITAVAVYFPDTEERMIDMYDHIKEVLNEEQVRLLLHAEDNFGYRPLENAAKQGTCRLMMAFFNTDKVYVHKIIRRNLFTYKYYDITEYEIDGGESRFHKSPLRHLSHLDRSRFRDPSVPGVFSKNHIINTWVDNNYAVNKPLILLWAALRLIFFVAYITIDSSEEWVRQLNGISEEEAAKIGFNQSYNGTHFIYCTNFTPVKDNSYISIPATILTVYCCGAWLIDIYGTVHYIRHRAYWRNLRKTWTGTKDSVNKGTWYMICNTLAMNLIISNVLSSRVTRTYSASFTSDIIRILANVTMIWSPLYFIQLLPSVGHFVMIIQRMIGDILNFSIVLVVIMFPFAQMILVFMNTNTKQGCIEEFHDFQRSVYSLILVMQNSINLSEFNVEKHFVLLVVHVVLIFFLTILLVNFLIAIMSASVSGMIEYRDTINSIQRLSISLTLEFRFRWMLKVYYNWMVRRKFVIENDKILLVKKEYVKEMK